MTIWKSIFSLLTVFSLLLAVSGCGSKDTTQFDNARTLFLDATEAAKQGDSAKAIEAFTKSIEVMPSAEAYMERAKLYAEAGRQEEALQDCQTALELAPENGDVKWLTAELQKPPKKRFQGKSASPPSSSK